MKNYFFILVFLFSSMLFSCKKEKISKHHSELAGRWRERNGTTSYRVLDIGDNSSGNMYNYYPGDNDDTKFRKFRIKNNVLYYGFGNNLGEITQFPIIAPYDMGLGFGNNDTIRAGTTYMVLNHNYFTKE